MKRVPDRGNVLPAPQSEYHSLLKNQKYLLWLLSESAAGGIGYSVYAITVLWLAYQISQNLLTSGLVLFIEFGVYSITFIAGPFVDITQDKRTVYLICYPLMAILAALIGFAFERNILTVPLLLFLVAVISLLWDFVWTVSNTVSPLILDKDLLFKAQGFSGLIGGTNQIIGYTVGGAFVLLVGPSGGMFFYSALLILGFVLIIPVSIRTPVNKLSSSFFKRISSDFVEGWRYVRAKSELLWLGSASVFRSFFVAGPPLLITLFANRIFSDSAESYTLLFISYVIGTATAGLLLGYYSPRKHIGTLFILSTLGAGIVTLCASLLTFSLTLSLIAWFLVGFSLFSFTIARGVYLQATTSPEFLGRVISNMYIFNGVSNSIGALIIGIVSSSLNPISIGLLVALGLILSSLFGIAPAVRKIGY